MDDININYFGFLFSLNSDRAVALDLCTGQLVNEATR